ncbi:MAG: tyrosine-type recombinase/integrase, partial [Ktedonobacteraceae bacterium]
MAQTSIYTREKIDGKWKHVRIEEGRGRRTGDLEPPFFVRPVVNGRQVWRKLDAQTFKDAKEESGALSGPSIGTPTDRISIRSAVDTYLQQKQSKAKKTRAQYRIALAGFMESLNGIQYLDQIAEKTLRTYKTWMEGKGYAGKTIDTRLNIVFFLLKKNSITVRLPKDEMPTVEEEPAVPYGDDELKKLFAKMTDEEKIRYKFFLGTACREREVTYASWQDVNWTKKELHVRSKPEVDFFVKNHESRSIPMPDSLVDALRDRQKKAAHSRWIFVNKDGNVEGHFLKKLKRISLKAGLNCGHCRTMITKGKYHTKSKVEVSCSTDPVCKHVYLHRLRKTCATRWQEHGVPVRTIQA